MEENTRIVSFEQGWNSVHLQRCLTKLKNILEGHSDTHISPDEYSMSYTTIYRMCTQKPPHDYSLQLYDKYRETFEYYITSTVLPSLREKHDDFMLLSDFVRRWSNHKLMVTWLSRFFNYLDRHLQNRISHRPLNVVALACFRDRVYEEVKGKVRDAVIYLIDQERKGKQIDRALLKKALETFVEIGNGLMEYYVNDFESSMLEETLAYYSREASNWISNKSFPDYILKAEECLEREKDRALAYLHDSSEPKLLEKVQHELLSVYATRLFKDKHCDYSQQLYDKHRETFEDYITLTVLPSLREKHDNDDAMLREFVRRWSNHKLMVRWLSRFFNYLDRFITCKSLPPLNEVGFAWFHDLVYQQVRRNVRDAVILLIHQEREGEKIDRVLLKNVVDIFVEIGKGRMEYYENDFESYMLKDTSAYYSCKASNWIKYDTCPDYMLKAEECLEREKDRALAYFHASSEPKLLEKVQHELLSVYAIQLLEKENSGFLALLRDPDNKGEELSRMYRLFSKIPQVLEHVSNMFKQHVTYESTRLAEQAEDAVSNNKAEKSDVFVRKVIELFYKYLTSVNDYFNNHTSFHEILKDAFELFCNMGVAGSSSAELVATFCDIILEKGGSEKLSEDTLKVVKLLAYVSDKDLFAEFYRKTLTRRLLFDESANVKNERSILTKLKQQYGWKFTSEMEEMVNDVELPKEIDFQFKENMEFDWL